MPISTRFKGLLSIAALGITALLAGCGQSTPSLPPQVVELGCPVQTDTEMQRIFSGVNGVDGLSRPLNNHGVPVDTNGNCLSTAPVPEVFAAPVSSAYVSVLQTRYHYSYVFVPTYVHVYSAPGVIYRQNVVPTGRVVVQTTRPAGTTVTVPAGNTTTVRPGAAPATSTSTTVSPGATTTVRPNATAAPAATAPAATPAAVTPQRAAAPTTTFNRPTATPAAVTPQRSTTPTTTFNRPTSTSSSSSRSSKR